MFIANIEARESVRSFKSIAIFFYMCISIFSFSLYKNESKSKEISIIFLLTGLFIVLLGLYIINIAIFSHYTGDSIFNMLDRDVIMINWKEIK